jgi:hypothetical protein
MVRYCIARKSKNKKFKTFLSKLNAIEVKLSNYLIAQYFEKCKMIHSIKFFVWRSKAQEVISFSNFRSHLILTALKIENKN